LIKEVLLILSLALAENSIAQSRFSLIRFFLQAFFIGSNNRAEAGAKLGLGYNFNCAQLYRFVYNKAPQVL
jgi:hypothetical protein